MQVSKISDSRVASRVFRTLRRVALGLALPLLAAACEPYSEINTKFWDSLDRAPFIQLPLSDAWISHPEVSLVLERHHGSVTEQRLVSEHRLHALHGVGDQFHAGGTVSEFHQQLQMLP